MSERINWILNRPYGYDEDFRFRYGESGERSLVPCEPILDAGLCLGIVGNSNLRPDQLMVSKKDREIIKVTVARTGETLEFQMPGKSAIIVLEPNLCDRKVLEKIVKIDLSGEPDRRDHLYVAKVGEILDTGWVPYWAPLQLQYRLAHARLVARGTIEEGKDPTLEDATRLRQVFTKVS